MSLSKLKESRILRLDQVGEGFAHIAELPDPTVSKRQQRTTQHPQRKVRSKTLKKRPKA